MFKIAMTSEVAFSGPVQADSGGNFITYTIFKARYLHSTVLKNNEVSIVMRHIS